MDLSQLTQLTLKDVLGFTVVGTLISTIGTFIALFLKEWVFTRSFEEWKSERSLETVYRKYKDPILLATIELCDRLVEICKNEHPPEFLQSEFLRGELEPPSRNSVISSYYNRYKLQSSIYRLCSLLGWLELFRQDIVFLHSSKNKINRSFEEAVKKVRNDFADGYLNNANDWQEWCDVLIFREEQRAIGESMITTGSNGRVVIGYGEFLQILTANSSSGKTHWIKAATRFLIDPELTKDFRLIRMKRLIVHLVDLIEALDASRLSNYHKKTRSIYSSITQTSDHSS
ncbi:hypothetical protein [Nostoc sp. C110]|uniref:hypothetical protein n=1 Tax=Nostoc sp. C110 TaxID=3349876 RepID=UPI00370D4C06